MYRFITYVISSLFLIFGRLFSFFIKFSLLHNLCGLDVYTNLCGVNQINRYYAVAAIQKGIEGYDKQNSKAHSFSLSTFRSFVYSVGEVLRYDDCV